MIEGWTDGTIEVHFNDDSVYELERLVPGAYYTSDNSYKEIIYVETIDKNTSSIIAQESEEFL
jgi:hypothetical protein